MSGTLSQGHKNGFDLVSQMSMDCTLSAMLCPVFINGR